MLKNLNQDKDDCESLGACRQQIEYLNRERTHSLDSLEEFAVDCSKNNTARAINRRNFNSNENHESELSEIPEIKIDFEYKLNPPVPQRRQQNKNFTVYDFKNKKFNEENIVKQRTRESLKFWKDEEEKLKNSHTSQTNKMASASHGPSAAISSNTNHDVDSYGNEALEHHISSSSSSHTTSLASNSGVSTSSTNNDLTSPGFSKIATSYNQTVEHGTGEYTDHKSSSSVFSLKRVKDRINVFESKKSQSNIPTPKKSANPVIKSRINSLEQKNGNDQAGKRGKSAETGRSGTKSERVTINNRAQTSTNNSDLEKTMAPSRSLDSNLDDIKAISSSSNSNSNSVPIQIPIMISNSKSNNSSTNNVLIPINYDDKLYNANSIKYTHKHTKEVINTIPRTSNLNEACQEVIHAIADVNQRNMHIHRSDSKDDSDLEEVEIIIDLNNVCLDGNEQKIGVIDENSPYDNVKMEDLDEKLKNMVMHIIPINRKAHVDDIVDGVKNLMSLTELIHVKSPVDLPENVIKYIQKKYANLLNEHLNNSSNTAVIGKAPDNLTISVNNASSALSTSALVLGVAGQQQQQQLQQSLDINGKNQNESFFINITTPNGIETTTEVTVVKEIRTEILSSGSECDFKPNQTDSNGDIMKVDEDTLYIVEKRAIQPPPSDIVDKEIRKNFKLKPKNGDQIQIENELNEKFKYNLSRLVDELKRSLNSFNYLTQKNVYDQATSDINDYQLHISKRQNHTEPVLVMLFDKKNEENFKFNLEKSYHKSIIETHHLNNKLDINIVARLNLFYVDSNSTDRFNSFSMIRTSLQSIGYDEDDENGADLKYMFPIGKYFINIKYKRLTDPNGTTKDSIVDLSLLPLALRAQLIYDCERYLKNKSSNSLNDSPIQINMLAIDSYLVQMEINKIRDDLIKEAIMNNKANLITNRKSDSSNSYTDVAELEKFIKLIENDLNSFYICNKVLNLDMNNDLVSNVNDDLVKLNKLDALASFKCVQKYKSYLFEESDDDTNTSLNKFYLIDNGSHYRCILPVKDLDTSIIESLTLSAPTSTLHSSQDNSEVIENIKKRQNDIFSKHLMSVFPFSNNKKSTSPETNDENLPSFSDSASVPYDNNFTVLDGQNKQKYKISMENKNEMISEESFNNQEYYNIDEQAARLAQNDHDNDHAFMQQHQHHHHQHQQQQSSNNYIDRNFISEDNDNLEFTSFETDRLKLNLNLDSLAATQTSRKEIRDQIIIKEIDQMFSSIRDHQCSNAKARGEQLIGKQRKKSGSWGYSTNKRHVKAKIMELPYVEDLSSLTRKLDLSSNDESFQPCEKVFVRIDDFINQDVSHVMQRSYSSDYLVFNGGPRTRIRYVQIPIQHKTQSIISYDYVPIANTEYRTAPYDLRYWSILKLLEEERQSQSSQKTQVFDYPEDAYLHSSNQTSQLKEMLINAACQVAQNENDTEINKDLEKFLSKHDLEKEVERYKKISSTLKPVQTASSSERTSLETFVLPNDPNTIYVKSPAYIIKERMMPSPSSTDDIIMPVIEKIDAELSKLNSDEVNKINRNVYDDKTHTQSNLKRQKVYQDKFKSSIIPQPVSVQNNGVGIQIPNSNYVDMQYLKAFCNSVNMTNDEANYEHVNCDMVGDSNMENTCTINSANFNNKNEFKFNIIENERLKRKQI